MKKEYEIIDTISNNSERIIHYAEKEGKGYVLKKYKTHNKSFFKEVDILKRFKHPNILNLVEILEDFTIVTKVYENDCYNMLLYNTIPITQRITIIKKIADAVNFLHSNNIIHMDIKPSNVFFNDDGETVLGDFGISHYCYDKIEINDDIPLTLSYAPPENLSTASGAIYKFSTDVWSFSVFCLEILTDQFLLPEGKNSSEILSLLREKTFFNKNEMIKNMCKNVDIRFRKKCENFLIYIVQYEEEFRPTMKEIIENELFKGLETNSGYVINEKTNEVNIELEEYIFTFQSIFLSVPHIDVRIYFLAIHIFTKILSMSEYKLYNDIRQFVYFSVMLAIDVEDINILNINQVDKKLYEKILLDLGGDYGSNPLYDNACSMEDLIQIQNDFEEGFYGRTIANIYGRKKEISFDIFYINYQI